MNRRNFFKTLLGLVAAPLVAYLPETKATPTMTLTGLHSDAAEDNVPLELARQIRERTDLANEMIAAGVSEKSAWPRRAQI